jgi:hypothetical protein
MLEEMMDTNGEDHHQFELKRAVIVENLSVLVGHDRML